MSFAITNKNTLSTVPLKDKQVIFSVDEQAIYADLYEDGEVRRKQYGGIDDYTAFEVFAHDYTIPVGDSAELGDYVTVAISPGMTETFILQMRDGVPQSENNVVIDWGDGATTDIASASVGTNGLIAINDIKYTVSHTYAETGKYIVRIYGTHYNEINHDFNGSNNLMCRVFDYDLPTHPQFVNYTRMCCHAPRLLKVETSSYASITKGVNFYRMFYCSTNLRYAYGFSRLGSLTTSGGVGAMFMNCSNLINTDMKIPCNSSNWMWMVDVFNGCKNLNTNLDVLLPACIFLSRQIDYTRAFKDCEKLGGTVPAKYFWDNSNLSLVRKDDCFAGCTKLASQVPASWGGTGSDSLIAPTVDQRVADIENTLEGLETTLAGI